MNKKYRIDGVNLWPNLIQWDERLSTQPLFRASRTRTMLPEPEEILFCGIEPHAKLPSLGEQAGIEPAIDEKTN